MKYTYTLLIIILMLPLLSAAQVFSRIDLIPGDEPVLAGFDYDHGTTEFNNKLWFTAVVDTMAGLWSTDGTTAGTDFIHTLTTWAQSDPIRIFAWDDKIYIAARVLDEADTLGVELYATDGTPSGLELIKNICLNDCHSWPAQFIALDNGILFVAKEEAGNESTKLYKTDGTTAGTIKLSNALSNFLTYNPADNNVYFNGENDTWGAELWLTDGSAQGTDIIKDIYPGSQGAYPHYLTAYGGKIYFSTFYWGNHLFVSDGTESGTHIFKTILEGTGTYPVHLAVHNELLYFYADDQNGRELWVTDGTVAGTMMVKDINPGGEDAMSTNPPAGAGDYLYFIADDGIHGAELWKTDGTEANTQLVKDIYPGADGSNIYKMTALGDKIYFAATTDGIGYKLYESDGTENGTTVIKPENATNEYPFQYAFEFSAVVFQEGLFFTADFHNTGPKLWRYGAEITATQEFSSSPRLRVYPNPAKGHFTIEISNACETTSVEVYNSIGNRLQTYDIQNTAPFSLDLTSYSNGIYFLVINAKNRIISRKIVKF